MAAAKHQIDPEQRVTSYHPGARLDLSLWQVCRNLLREALTHHWHIWVTFKRDFQAGYRQTGLGFWWALIQPLVPISVYILLASIKVLPHDAAIPPMVYITIGVTLWMFMANGITAPLNAIGRQKSIVARTSFPLIGVALSSYAQVCFETLIRLILVVIVYGIFVGLPPIHALWLPLLLIPTVLFALGLGMFLAILNVIYPDVSKIADIVLRYGIFLSSAIFPLPKLDWLQQLSLFNPFATYINNIRQVVVHGTFSDLDIYLYTGIAAVLIFLFACKVFYVMEYRIKGAA